MPISAFLFRRFRHSAFVYTRFWVGLTVLSPRLGKRPRKTPINGALRVIVCFAFASAYGLSSNEYPVNQAVRACFFRGHIIIPIRVSFDGRDVPARVFRKDTVEFCLRTQNVFRLNFDIACLALRATERLMNHDFGIGKSVSLATRTAREQERAHRRRHTDTNGGYVAFDIIHRVVNRHTRGYRTPGGVDIQTDIFRRVLTFQIDKLRNDGICHRVVDFPT